ncbi:MAG: T9SS type A sorting domain-containing protein [Bacteroidetes bacterium]|nr:T9SS type A sorting domain-containing protein [Bacteroidota bacterium]MCW5895990.1 T9SS type A sorting domain-containing protein [Bacteroidota bacterium]
MHSKCSGLIIMTFIAVHVVSAQSFLTLISPAGNEQWSMGFTYPIKWTAFGVDTVRIEYSTSGQSGPWMLITPGVPSDLQAPGSLSDLEEQDEFTRSIIRGRYYWTIPWSINDSCYIRISHKSNPSLSDVKRFTVKPYWGWIVQVSEVDIPLYTVQAIGRVAFDAQYWAGGKHGVVIRTTDRGIHWIVSGILEGDVRTIAAWVGFYPGTAVAGSVMPSGRARISRTTNEGRTWSVVDTTATVWRSIRFVNANKAYAIGDPVGNFWVLKKTTNDGITWIDIQPPLPATAGEGGFYNAAAWIDSTRGWFGTNDNAIYRTTDGGSTWTKVFVQPGSSGITAIHFFSILHGLAGSADGSVYRSTDGGVSWTKYTTKLPTAITGISGLTYPSECWAISGPNIYHSQNGGETWAITQYDGYAGIAQLHHISLAGEQTAGLGCAVGENGTAIGFYRFLTGVQPQPHTRAEAFELFQSFPNPFNPSTTIEFRISNFGFVSLKVFDVLGREVATLVNEVNEAGEHSVTFDGRNLPSGVFFYQMKSGSFTQTRKLLLLR